MSYEIPGFTRSYPVTSDLSASWCKFVKLSGANVVAATAATDKVIGVLQNKPGTSQTVAITSNAGSQVAAVMIAGVTRCVAAKALAAGVPVYIDATGAVTDTAAANVAVGVTETSCSNAGELVAVLLKPLAAVA